MTDEECMAALRQAAQEVEQMHKLVRAEMSAAWKKGITGASERATATWGAYVAAKEKQQALRERLGV